MENCVDEKNIVKTNIPLTVAPLPAPPQHLLKKTTERPPLNTLVGPNNEHSELSRFVQSAHYLAGSSNAKNKIIVNSNSPNTPFKIDTEFVTFKRGCDDSCLFKYKKETRRRSLWSILCISSDDNCDGNIGNEMEMYFSDKDWFLYRRASANTPAALHKLQPAAVKNIKHSLKRPYSRELQGISPVSNRDKPDDDRVRRRLDFNPTLRERMEAPAASKIEIRVRWVQNLYMESTMNREYSAHIFSFLLQAEVKPSAPPRVRSETRACAINWLIKVNGVDGNPATIQTAIWFLDAVLSSGNNTLENMQLVAAASYWIATKIHGGPLTSASKLVRYCNNIFTPLRLLEAEKIILTKLKFPVQPVVPQDFLCYLAWWCNSDRPGEVEAAATFLCLCGMMVNKSLCLEYPSVVAAASIRNALLLLRMKELMPYLQNCPVFVVAESKAKSITNTCAILRHAVRTVASKNYGYSLLYEQYGTQPKYIAQTIVIAANELAGIDVEDLL